MQLRDFQVETLKAIRAKSHVICVAPTGSGKSLIYEKLATENRKKLLLVTPLVALARQQQRNLEDLGVHCIRNERPDAETQAWIISPELLQFQNTHALIRKFKPHVLVVDECHCLWDWGESFRPSFLEIPKLLSTHSFHASCWLTATLPVKARKFLRSALPENLPLVEIGSFALPEQIQLFVQRVPWIERNQALIRWIKSHPDPGIVFASTREFSEKLSRLLFSLGRKSIAYHAGLSQDERRNIEKMISNEEVDVVVATSAFGMGMHHPFLKWVLLWQAPTSLLALTQTMGRIARSSARGHAILFWDYDDFRTLEWTLKNSIRKKEDLKEVLQFVTSEGCRTQALRNYFGKCPEASPTSYKDLTKSCRQCDFCVA